MDVLSSIQNRRSYRKYLKKPIEFEKIGIILEAACCAPSSGNLQHWKFIIVNDRDKVEKIAGYSFQQYWISNAPMLIAVCSICEKQESFFGKRGSMLYSIQGVAAAIENMLLAATGLGLGSCWVGGFEEDRVKDILQVPSNVNLHALITLGYPDEIPQKKDIIPLDTCVYFDVYGNRIKNINILLKDYSLELEKIAKKAKPDVDRLMEKLKSLKDKIAKK